MRHETENSIQRILDCLEVSIEKLGMVEDFEIIGEDEIAQIRARSHDLMMDILRIIEIETDE